MLEQTKRTSFRISSVLSKVEPKPGAGPSHRLRLRPKSTGSGSATLLAATQIYLFFKSQQPILLLHAISITHSRKSINRMFKKNDLKLTVYQSAIPNLKGPLKSGETQVLKSTIKAMSPDKEEPTKIESAASWAIQTSFRNNSRPDEAPI